MLQDAGGAVKEPRFKKGGMRPGGFEPPTNSLEGCCSIHLSYGRGSTPKSGRRDSNPRPPGPKPGALPDCATPRTTRRLDAQENLLGRASKQNLDQRSEGSAAVGDAVFRGRGRLPETHLQLGGIEQRIVPEAAFAS